MNNNLKIKNTIEKFNKLDDKLIYILNEIPNNNWGKIDKNVEAIMKKYSLNEYSTFHKFLNNKDKIYDMIDLTIDSNTKNNKDIIKDLNRVFNKIKKIIKCRYSITIEEDNRSDIVLSIKKKFLIPFYTISINTRILNHKYNYNRDDIFGIIFWIIMSIEVKYQYKKITKRKINKNKEIEIILNRFQDNLYRLYKDIIKLNIDNNLIEPYQYRTLNNKIDFNMIESDTEKTIKDIFKNKIEKLLNIVFPYYIGVKINNIMKFLIMDNYNYKLFTFINLNNGLRYFHYFVYDILTQYIEYEFNKFENTYKDEIKNISFYDIRLKIKIWETIFENTDFLINFIIDFHIFGNNNHIEAIEEIIEDRLKVFLKN